MGTRDNLVKVFKKTLKAEFPDSVVLDPATLERDLQERREYYCGRFAREIRPLRMAPEECKKFEDEFDQIITEIFERRNRANEEIVETATMKMGPRPSFLFPFTSSSCTTGFSSLPWLVVVC